MENNPRKIIQPITKISDEEKAGKKAPEQREYLICFFYNDECTSWVKAVGRTAAYDACRTEIMAGDVDVDESIVLVEGGEYGKHATLYQFMKHMENFFPPEVAGVRFDIEDYVVGDSENEYGSEYQKDFEVRTPIDITNGGIDEGEDI